MWCYWEHLGGHIGNLMGTAWELYGNTLGAYKNTSLPKTQKKKNQVFMNVIRSMKITKRDDKIRVLNLNPKYETKEAKQKHKMCKTKIQICFYSNKLKKHKHKNNIIRL